MSFPILPGYEVQGTKAIAYMKAKGYKVRALNIVLFEGINTDLKTLNNDRIDEWNDVRTIISDKGDVLMAASCTTEPGWYYRLNPLNENGAAQVAFGQYLDSHCFGMHYSQRALVQCGTLRVYRDKNRDGSRAGDKAYEGDDFAINLHTTGNDESVAAPDKVSRWSAGCNVGQYASTHYNTFLPICRAMGLKTFDTTWVDGSDFVKAMQ